MQGLRQALVRNLGIKITSLLLACAVYAHVYARQEQEAVLRLPLVLEGLPEGLTYRGDVAEAVPVRFRAKGSELIRLRTQPPRVVISLAHAQPGLLQRPVSINDVVLPDKSSATVLGLVDATVLSLQVEPLVSARRPVAVPLRGSPGGGAVRSGPVRVWPETLTVSGPAGMVASIDSVRTSELDIGGHAESFGASLHLLLPKGLRASADQVSVRVPLQPVEHRAYGPLAVQVPPGLRASWRPDPDSVVVHLAGPRNILESLRASDLRLRVVGAAPPAEGQTVSLEAVLPASVKNQVRVESFEPRKVVLRPRNP